MLSSANGKWPHYSDDEISAVTEVLRSGQVNQWTGKHVASFEAAFKKYCDMPHAIAVSNGTAALELALRALGVSEGDEVIVTSRSFVASASCVRMVGAVPVFADVDSMSQNVTVETIAEQLTPKSKAIIPVHLAGWPCDMAAIMKFAIEHNLKVIEDCAQAIGSQLDGKPIGSFGDAAAFSFCQDKIISTGGEGGMVLFRDATVDSVARSFKDHGKSANFIKQPTRGKMFRYLHDSIGTNLRMTSMQAVIGTLQLEKLEDWIALRQRNASVWRDAFEPVECLSTPIPCDRIRHAYYKFYTFLKPDQLVDGVTREDVLSALNDAGISVTSGSCPEIYREKAFSSLAVEPRPTASKIGRWSIMFDVHPNLDLEQLRHTAVQAAKIIETFQVKT